MSINLFLQPFFIFPGPIENEWEKDIEEDLKHRQFRLDFWDY